MMLRGEDLTAQVVSVELGTPVYADVVDLPCASFYTITAQQERQWLDRAGSRLGALGTNFGTNDEALANAEGPWLVEVLVAIRQ
jgi:hypothetical protein